jgi:formylglycine-generating enzyme required for sulfatase activity
MAESVRVFVSHHHSPEEDAFTARLVGDLEAAGADVWVDDARITSDDFIRKINEGLAGRQWLVLVMTPDALRSQWVQAEVNAALNQVRKGRMLGVVPIVAKVCDAADIPALLDALHRYDATRDYTGAVQGLLRAMGLPTSIIVRPPAQPPLGDSSPPTIAPKRPTPSPTILPSVTSTGAPSPEVGASAKTAGRHGQDTSTSSSPGISRRTLIGSGAAAGLALAGGGVWLTTHASTLFASAGSSPTNTPSVPVTLSTRLTSLGFSIKSAGSTSYILPPVSTVSAGEFLMGSDPKKDTDASENEKPQQRLTLGAFEVGTYEVTVAEYNAFVRSGHTPPGYWSNQLTKLDNPVVYVTWRDAMAYATWLANLTGQPWRLPTEAEWEKAARGIDGRIYPWGNTFDSSRANTDVAVHADAGAAPVGTYPSGASPYGAQDMLGNVWEWTSSVFMPYPYSATDGREDLSSGSDRVLRGGSWSVYVDSWARVASRDAGPPDYVYNDGGFRLVRAARSS